MISGRLYYSRAYSQGDVEDSEVTREGKLHHMCTQGTLVAILKHDLNVNKMSCQYSICFRRITFFSQDSKVVNVSIFK